MITLLAEVIAKSAQRGLVEVEHQEVLRCAPFFPPKTRKLAVPDCGLRHTDTPARTHELRAQAHWNKDGGGIILAGTRGRVFWFV